ncbi:type II toxin-antitoxin system VapC family toxin [Methanoregula sp.]|uniref:type II toxin-antitoxin system VapC family toxin n=1 Tax=Methanoregula sp. TaxID=2052170 RepID=UPI0035629E90
MPVADTSFLVDLMRRDPGALRSYAGFEQQGIALSTSAVTAMELYKGAYVSKNPDNPLKVRTILELFTLLPLDETVYEVFGRIAAGLYLAGTPVGDFDEVIAAIALCHDGEIITRDAHFKKIPGLTVTGY